MPETTILGPVKYESHIDSHRLIANDHTCTICKEPIGLDRSYLFWFKGNTFAPKDFRRAHEKCFDEKYGTGV